MAGCAVALALRERDADVTVVERRRPGAGATRASAGMLSPLYEAEGLTPSLRLGLAGLEAYPGFVATLEELGGGEVHLRRDGLLVAAFDEDEHEAALRAVRWQRDAGLASDVLDPGDARRLEPALGGDAISWLWFPTHGQVDAQRLADALEPSLLASGARLAAGLAVTAIRSRSGSVTGVELSDGSRLAAERVVLAAGAWSGTIGGLPRRLPIRPVRGQMIRVRPAPDGLRRLVADHRGCYVVPRDDGSALAGSTMEEAGFVREVTDEGLRRIRRATRRLTPAIHASAETDRWAGLRPFTPDGVPVIGLDPDLAGLAYVTAYGRNGILVAPPAAELVADALLSGASGPDLEPFAPDRFPAGHR